MHRIKITGKTNKQKVNHYIVQGRETKQNNNLMSICINLSI